MPDDLGCLQDLTQLAQTVAGRPEVCLLAKVNDPEAARTIAGSHHATDQGFRPF